MTQLFHNGHPSHCGDRKTFEVMTSTKLRGTLGSLASLLAATLSHGNPDMNHMIWNIVLIEKYILHMQVLLECYYINIYIVSICHFYTIKRIIVYEIKNFIPWYFIFNICFVFAAKRTNRRRFDCPFLKLGLMFECVLFCKHEYLYYCI